MKILVFTDHYYPDILGGYEVGCSLVTEELIRRGHNVTVLTTDCRRKLFPRRDNIFRILPYNLSDTGIFFLDFILRIIKEIKNLILLKQFLKKKTFDVIYVWSIRGFFTTSMISLEKMKTPMIYYLFDNWTVDLKGHVPIGWFCNMEKYHFIKIILKNFYLLLGCNPVRLPEINYPQYCSSVIKKQFESVYPHSERPIIHFGIQKERYPYSFKKLVQKKIIWLGRLCSEKGLHIAFEAVHILKKIYPEITLDIYGGFDRQQNKYIQSLFMCYGSPDYIFFHQSVPHEQIPGVLSQYDILIFSSMWNEPYGLVPLEAMAAGVVVVSTGDGGSIDYSRDGYNCLLYNPSDAQDCSEKIRALFDNPELYQRIRNQARKFIESEMDFYKTVDVLENDLNEIYRTEKTISNSK